MASIDLSKTSNTRIVEYGIAQETAIDETGDVITHHFTALDYTGPGEFVPTETYIVDADLTIDEIADTILR